MQPGARRSLIALALAATLGAWWWAPSPPEVPAPAPERGPRGTGDAAPPALPRDLARTPLAAEVPDAFAARSWRPPPPPARAAAPSAPVAPPLPFAYIGKLLDEGATTVFLARGAQNLAVKLGETIDGQYRLDALNEGAVTLTYLPLAQQQTLSLGRPE